MAPIVTAALGSKTSPSFATNWRATPAIASSSTPTERLEAFVDFHSVPTRKPKAEESNQKRSGHPVSRASITSSNGAVSCCAALLLNLKSFIFLSYIKKY